jgi:periplasmic protein TonB
MRLTLHAFLVGVLALLFFEFVAPRAATAQEAAAFDTPPAPVGGLTAIMQNVTYPKAAMKDGIEGKVLLAVVVDAAGHTKSASVQQSVRKDLDEAALKAIKKSEWIPAQKDGKPVACTIIVPIQFKLEKKSQK